MTIILIIIIIPIYFFLIYAFTMVWDGDCFLVKGIGVFLVLAGGGFGLAAFGGDGDFPVMGF
jgi:hypothetical protein